MLPVLVIVTLLVAGLDDADAATACPSGTVACANGTCAMCDPGCLSTCKKWVDMAGKCGDGGCDGPCASGYVFDSRNYLCVDVNDPDAAAACPYGTAMCANGTCAKCDAGCLSTCQNRLTKMGKCGYGGCDGPCDKGYIYVKYFDGCFAGGPGTCPNGTVTCANGTCAMCDRGCLSTCKKWLDLAGGKCGYGGCDGPCASGYFFDKGRYQCVAANPPCNCTAYLLVETSGGLMFKNPNATGTKCIGTAGGLKTDSCDDCCYEYLRPIYEEWNGGGADNYADLNSWSNPH